MPGISALLLTLFAWGAAVVLSFFRIFLGQPSVVTEGDMKNLNWNSAIQALVLVRLGQELGTDSRLARALHELFDAVLMVWR